MNSFEREIVSVIGTEPVLLDFVKQYLQIDADYAAEDGVLESIITGAIEKLEAHLNLYFYQKNILVQFNAGVFDLPSGPTGVINSVVPVTDEINPDPLVLNTDYRIDGLNYKRLLIGAPYCGGFYDDCYPIFDKVGASYTRGYIVDYVTGFAENALPTGLKNALLAQIDYEYKGRGNDSLAALSPIACNLARPYSKNPIL